jgi:hypothetical protein
MPEQATDSTCASFLHRPRQREGLEQRLRRMRDLYELGDLERGKYVARRNAINAERKCPAHHCLR